MCKTAGGANGDKGGCVVKREKNRGVKTGFEKNKAREGGGGGRREGGGGV